MRDEKSGADRGDLGEDGYVRLRAYLPLARTTWISFACCGCGHDATLSIAAAIEKARSAAVTVDGLARHLRCARCGRKHPLGQIAVDGRPQETIAREGLHPNVLPQPSTDTVVAGA